MKAVQVMATYFGSRRHYPFNAEGVKELITKQIQWLKDFDLGYPTDLLIVNHDIEIDGVANFLHQYNDTALHNGVVRILNRPFFEPDLSFASYKYAFTKHNSEYDYWYFNEDDVIINHPSLVKDMIDLFESDPTLGFIATSNFVNYNTHLFEYDDYDYILKTGNGDPHAHGGCGLTSTKVFFDVCNKFPDFMSTANIKHETTDNYVEKKLPGGYMEGYREIDFSHRFIQAGYKMKCISKGSSFVRLQDGGFL